MPKSVPNPAKENTTANTEETIKKLIMALSSDDDPARKVARQSLVAIGSPAVVPLMEALKQKDDHVRREAVKALSAIVDPKAAPALIKSLEDEEFDIRWLAAEGLVGLGMDGLNPLLQAVVERGDSPLLLDGAHHVVHDMAKGGLKKYLRPVLASLEGVGTEVKAPVAASHALDMMREAKIL